MAQKNMKYIGNIQNKVNNMNVPATKHDVPPTKYDIPLRFPFPSVIPPLCNTSPM